MDSILNRESVTCSLTITVHWNLNKSVHSACSQAAPSPRSTRLFPWLHTAVSLAAHACLSLAFCWFTEEKLCYCTYWYSSYSWTSPRGTNAFIFTESCSRRRERKCHCFWQSTKITSFPLFFTLSLSVQTCWFNGFIGKIKKKKILSYFCHLALYLFASFILLLSSHNSQREAVLWHGGWVQSRRLKQHNIFKKSWAQVCCGCL